MAVDKWFNDNLLTIVGDGTKTFFCLDAWCNTLLLFKR